MKTVLLGFIMIALLAGPDALAQGTGRYRPQMTIGVRAGGNLYTMAGKDFMGGRLDNGFTTGFHAGANVQIPVLHEVYFQPGLLYSVKGAQEKQGEGSGTFKVSYLELPLNVVYKTRLDRGFFFVGLGPYVGYGIEGKILTKAGATETVTPIKFKNQVEPADQLTAVHLRKMDAGAGFLIGYEMFAGLFIQVNAQLGVMKINPEYTMLPEDDSSIRNAGSGLSLGFRF